MKKSLNSIHLVMACVLTLSLFTTNSYARAVLYEDQDITLARVLEVISGEAIKVIAYDSEGNGKVELIRMVGIETDSSQEAYMYTYKRLLGKRVMLLPDDHEASFEPLNGWLYRHVYISSKESVGEELLENGFATVNTKFETSEQYDDLMAAELRGKKEETGVWHKPETQSEIGINVNTATATELTEILEDTTYAMANALTRYRKYNAFNHVEEVKYAGEDFTKAWFDKNRYKISVVTNLNDASFEEIRSLFGDMTVGEEQATDFLQYRLFNQLDSLYEVKNIPSLKQHYSTIEPYVALYNTDTYIPTEEVKAININTASMNQIIRTCFFTHSRVNDIIKERNDQSFIIKSFGQLEKNNLLSNYGVAANSDNITFYTDINSAGLNELESLFGFIDMNDHKMEEFAKVIMDNRPYYDISNIKHKIGYRYYNLIKPYIYVDEKATEYININLADKDSAATILGMTSEDREKYLASNIRYSSSAKIKFDYDYYADSFTLYTNINKATRYELEHIEARVWKDSKYQYEKLPKVIIDDIIEFREDQPFNAKEELQDIFKEHKKTSMYTKIIDYIVFY
ncbi:thermonuclease family protein [Vallitalea pronyensis]|uniref:Thermonuclease family protein n=1 Tax=Vallitalea pronyensis TaxID=1348613 RepID=A0A8J8SHI4_9FIRM|nr:thermonuclease family protein [Vallitalea pronyensis]QUI23428.1 thermonuclease family protein [Vallitalea pronyensis]